MRPQLSFSNLSLLIHTAFGLWSLLTLCFRHVTFYQTSTELLLRSLLKITDRNFITEVSTELLPRKDGQEEATRSPAYNLLSMSIHLSGQVRLWKCCWQNEW